MVDDIFYKASPFPTICHTLHVLSWLFRLLIELPRKWLRVSFTVRVKLRVMVISFRVKVRVGVIKLATLIGKLLGTGSTLYFLTNDILQKKPNTYKFL